MLAVNNLVLFYESRNLPENTNFIVAYSGGIDSRVLLELAYQAIVVQNKLSGSLSALHINHQLSTNSTQWAEHCQQTCNKLEIDLAIFKANVCQDSEMSLEEAARLARRNIWSQQLTNNDVLLLAHHADDQAETILYRLLRGTGPKGLQGMPEWGQLGQGSISRPLLTYSKKDIQQYATAQRLQWIEDESNTNTKFDRNYLRHKILPSLSKRWPSAISNIVRAGQLCGELVTCIEPKAAELLDKLQNKKNRSINITKLLDLSTEWRHQVMRCWLQQFAYTPSYAQLQLIEKEVMLSRKGANPRLNLDPWEIRRSKNNLYLCEKCELIQPTRHYLWSQWPEPLTIPGYGVLSANTILQAGIPDEIAKQGLGVRLGNHGRKAKKIFQDQSIPPWQRIQYPLIFLHEKLICIVGLWVAKSI